MKNLLLENFTKEELEGKKGFTWEESFEPGYYIKEAEINYPSSLKKIKIDKACNKEPHVWFKNQFRTEKQALSALAFAQLSHIVAKYNEGKEIGRRDGYFSVTRMESGELDLVRSYGLRGLGLEFCREEDGLVSMETNKELWEQYWSISAS
jgi:hypothetical protein